MIKKYFGSQFLGMIDYFRFPEHKMKLGGAFNGQSLRQEIFKEITAKIKFEVIVETGTYRGTTTEFMCRAARLPVYTVEKNERFYGYLKSRFFLRKNIFIYLGDSRNFLMDLSRKYDLINKSLFFYLDAHWETDLPLGDEVRIIFEHWPAAVVMVDDFKVPGDDGYAYDDYGGGNELSLDYLKRSDLTAFFPGKSSDFETGRKRGCVVLAQNNDVIKTLKRLDVIAAFEKK